MIKEKPIIFSTEMVKAILENRKFQTRMVIKPQPDHCHRDVIGKETPYSTEGWNKLLPQIGEKEIKWPWQVEDILWVRETWCMVTALNDCEGKHSNQCGGIDSWDYYKADGKILPSDFKWKPSIRMPRAAARLFLKVKDIRVERLQEITAEDIRSEGLPSMGVHCSDYELAIAEWKTHWDNLNAKRGYGWGLNPWVWVISFERVNQP